MRNRLLAWRLLLRRTSLRIQSAVEWMRELKALVVQEGWAASAPDLSRIPSRCRRPDAETSLPPSPSGLWRRMLRSGGLAERRKALGGLMTGVDLDDPSVLPDGLVGPSQLL